MESVVGRRGGGGMYVTCQSCAIGCEFGLRQGFHKYCTVDLPVLWRLFFAFVILYYNYSLGGVYSPIGLWLVSVVFCTIWHCSTESDTVFHS